MRLMFVITMLIISISMNAQSPFMSSYGNSLQLRSPTDNNQFNDSIVNKKWFISKYAGISSGIGFYNGGSAALLSVPMALQLNRRLTSNWFAFANVTVAPTYINFSHSFQSMNASKFGQQNNFLTANRFNMYSRAEMGLMYVNDQKTFSISGSIGIERSSYPFVPFNQRGSVKPTSFNSPIK